MQIISSPSSGVISTARYLLYLIPPEVTHPMYNFLPHNFQISMHQIYSWAQNLLFSSRKAAKQQWLESNQTNPSGQSHAGSRSVFCWQNLSLAKFILQRRICQCEGWIALVEEQSSLVFLPHQPSGSESRWAPLRNLFPQETCLDNSPTDGLPTV